MIHLAIHLKVMLALVFGILCQVIQRSHMQLEFSALTESPRTRSRTDKVRPCYRYHQFHRRFRGIKTRYLCRQKQCGSSNLSIRWSFRPVVIVSDNSSSHLGRLCLPALSLILHNTLILTASQEVLNLSLQWPLLSCHFLLFLRFSMLNWPEK